MSGYSVEQQNFISEYRTSHNLGYVISDDAVMELIKKDIESGKIPAGFAVLAQDVAVQKKTAEISLFKQDIASIN